MALKGLTEFFLSGKESAEKLIKDSLKLGMKNSKVWHFYALFHKEQKNYAQTVRCYMFANKYEPDNLTILKDLSNLLLYLGNFDDFAKYSLQCLTTKSSLGVNWVQYSLAEYFLKNYEKSLQLIDSVIKNFEDTMKKQEMHEVLLFKSNILFKLKRYEECIDLLEKNMDKWCVDRATFIEKIINSCIQIHNVEKGIKYCIMALKINPENINIYLSYFNLKIKDLNLSKYEDLFTLEENSPKRKEIYDILVKEIEPELTKVKINEKIKLGLLEGDEFKKLFCKYFYKNIKSNLPSFFNNIKFIYQYPQQKSKIPIIESVLTSNITKIESGQILSDEILSLNIDNSNINIPTTFIWVYYFSAQHFEILGNSEKALEYINKAIKSTPTVVEFFMVKSRILKHNLLYEEAAKSMGKAKDLDLSDRYLNAKHAKSVLRNGNVDESTKIMCEFVKNPLLEENMLRYQCLWFKIETGIAYLKSGKLLLSHRMFKGILDNFKEMYEDQSDFYNYSLRRYMLSDFYNLINYTKNMYKNKNVINSLFYLDLIRSALQFKFKKNESELRKELEEEYKIAKETGETQKYIYTNYEDLIRSINDDLYEFLKIIQPLGNNPRIHYLCLKEFLLRNKPIKALKSYLILVKNETNGNNFFGYKAHYLFTKYIKENEPNMKKEIVDFIKKKIGEVDTKKVEQFNNCGTNMEKIKFQLLNCDNMFDENNEKSIEKFIDEISIEEIRRSKSNILNEIFCFVSLFIGSENLKKLQEKWREKVKIKIDNYDEEISGNLTLYQSEEEALKLFPNFRRKVIPKEEEKGDEKKEGDEKEEDNKKEEKKEEDKKE